MEKILDLPHRVCESTCFINGLEDILEKKGSKYPDYLLSVLGGFGESGIFYASPNMSQVRL
jgi:hypothetical protein